MATTPTGLQPTASESGIPLDGLFELQWSKYVDAGALTYQRVIIYSNAGGTALVWDSGWMAPGEPGWADGRLSIDAARLLPETAADRWWKAAIRDNVPSTSSYSPLMKFTYATAALTAAQWIEAQP